jgi:DNA-binding Lrp family transcriptional regulator
MKIDKIDQKLLYELTNNSRIPLTKLSKKLRISRKITSYRIEKLNKNNIINNFTTEINYSKLGYMGAAVFINIKAKKQNEFKEYLNKCNFVSWLAELSGIWSFGFSIIGKTEKEIDNKFLSIYKNFKEDIIDHRFTLHRKSTFYYEKYFGKVIEERKRKYIDYKIDLKDKQILKELSNNSRIDYVTLSKIMKISPPAVRTRIKNLENSGIIEKYSLFVNLFNLDVYQYSIFIKNKNIDIIERFLNYLSEHPKVSFIAEYLGDPFLEFGIMVDNPYQLREILQEIEESFPDNKLLEISLFQKEFVSVSPPSCIFE